MTGRGRELKDMMERRNVDVMCLQETKWKGSKTRNIGSVVEWLKRRARDQHGLSSKPIRTILLWPWERHFTPHSPAWWSWQAVLNYSHISIKLQADSNILVFIYLFSFLLTINLKLIKVHIEIKIVNKEAATKRSTLLHAHRQLCMVAVPLNKAM